MVRGPIEQVERVRPESVASVDVVSSGPTEWGGKTLKAQECTSSGIKVFESETEKANWVKSEKNEGHAGVGAKEACSCLIVVLVPIEFMPSAHKWLRGGGTGEGGATAKELKALSARHGTRVAEHRALQ